MVKAIIIFIVYTDENKIIQTENRMGLNGMTKVIGILQQKFLHS